MPEEGNTHDPFMQTLQVLHWLLCSVWHHGLQLRPAHAQSAQPARKQAVRAQGRRARSPGCLCLRLREQHSTARCLQAVLPRRARAGEPEAPLAVLVVELIFRPPEDQVRLQPGQ